MNIVLKHNRIHRKTRGQIVPVPGGLSGPIARAAELVPEIADAKSGQPEGVGKQGGFNKKVHRNNKKLIWKGSPGSPDRRAGKRISTWDIGLPDQFCTTNTVAQGREDYRTKCALSECTVHGIDPWLQGAYLFPQGCTSVQIPRGALASCFLQLVHWRLQLVHWKTLTRNDRY